MPYGRYRKSSPMKSNKHEITWSSLGQNASTVQSITLAFGTDVGASASSTQIPVGRHIKAIYFEFHFSAAQTGNVNVIHWNITKAPFDTTLSIPSLYFQDDRRFIIKRGMEMIPVNVSTVFKRIFVVRIPKRMQRLAQSDRWTFRYIASSTQTINACGIAIYKEIY